MAEFQSASVRGKYESISAHPNFLRYGMILWNAKYFSLAERLYEIDQLLVFL
jgi:hypothetical protein